MKTAVSMFSFAQDADLREKFALIRRAGYDGVEPVMSEAGYLTHLSSEAEIRKIGKIAADNGLEIPSVGVWSLWENNPLSDDPAIREKAKAILIRLLEAAKILGADTVLAVPGYVGCEFAARPERIRYDIAYERCVKLFSDLAKTAESLGVSIGIENVWNKFLLSPLEMKRFISDTGSSSVGVYFDVGNILYTGYPEDWIRILGPAIKKIHLSDYRSGQAGLGAFVDLFAGDVDFMAVAAALKEIGYDDYLTLEMLPNYRMFPDVSVFSNRPAVEKILELCRAA